MARAGEPEETVDTSTLGKTPHTRFAVNIEMWFTAIDSYPERMRQSADLGFPAIEFWPWRPHDIGELAETAAELGIEIAQFTAWGFEPGMNDPKNEDAFVGRSRKPARSPTSSSASKMCVVAGNNQPGMTQEQMHAQCIKASSGPPRSPRREKVMLILEPMNGRVDHPGHCLYGSVDAVRDLPRGRLAAW